MQNSVSKIILYHIVGFFFARIKSVSTATGNSDFAGKGSTVNAEIVLDLKVVLECKVEHEDLFNLNDAGSLIGIFK